jgi:4-diphosphocytidyl-2-C-methyl-D-erythritol kinase
VSAWRTAAAPAKLNLALVVGPVRHDGKHEIVTVLERLSLADTVSVRPARATRVTGFAGDTLVRGALEAVARAAGGAACFEARIEKRVPVAAGLGGGSSDAAAALTLANGLLPEPLAADVVEGLAIGLGADVPFFLHAGPQLATGDGTTLRPVDVPRGYTVVLALPRGAAKASTAEVYAAFDARDGAAGFGGRRAALLEALQGCATVGDLARLPANDLASSPLASELRARGAVRADVTGAGPVVYGLFSAAQDAAAAAAALAAAGETWVTTPASVAEGGHRATGRAV